MMMMVILIQCLLKPYCKNDSGAVERLPVIFAHPQWQRFITVDNQRPRNVLKSGMAIVFDGGKTCYEAPKGRGGGRVLGERQLAPSLLSMGSGEHCKLPQLVPIEPRQMPGCQCILSCNVLFGW